MKILYHHRIRSKDGQYVHVEELVNALRAAGHEVTVVGPKHIDQASFGADAGVVTALKRHLPRAVYELLELAYSIPAFLRLLSRAMRGRPDVIYERYNLFFPAGTWVKRLLGLPMLLEVNAPLFVERSRFGGIALRRIARWSERYVWRAADYVLVVTKTLGRHASAAGVQPARIRVIPNGINTERFGRVPTEADAKRALGLIDKCVLGFVGFVRDWHGLDGVIEFLAAQRDAGLHLVIVGDGPARENLERCADRLGVRHQVTITGIVDRDNVAARIAAFDVALQPAVVEYASPLKLFEYMALSKAIVAPASENICEVLTDSENALLFDPQDRESLHRALRRLCADAALRARLGRSAAAAIETRGLTWAHNAQRVADLASRASGGAAPASAVRV